MPTQGHTTDPKCKLNISSLLTLPHLLDSLICIRNYVRIILLLSMIREWDGRERRPLTHTRVLVEEKGGGYYVIEVFECAFVFCSLMSRLFFEVRRAW